MGVVSKIKDYSAGLRITFMTLVSLFNSVFSHCTWWLGHIRIWNDGSFDRNLILAKWLWKEAPKC